MDTLADLPVDEHALETIRSTLERHSVSFALLFGSGSRETATDIGDVDVAIEFDDLRPDDEGYSDVYLRLLSDLDQAVSIEIDAVDVHTMPPRFARIVFDQGVLFLGTEQRRDELRDELAGDSPSVSDARERVTAAVDRLHNES